MKIKDFLRPRERYAARIFYCHKGTNGQTGKPTKALLPLIPDGAGYAADVRLAATKKE